MNITVSKPAPPSPRWASEAGKAGEMYEINLFETIRKDRKYRKRWGLALDDEETREAIKRLADLLESHYFRLLCPVPAAKRSRKYLSDVWRALDGPAKKPIVGPVIEALRHAGLSERPRGRPPGAKWEELAGRLWDLEEVELEFLPDEPPDWFESTQAEPGAALNELRRLWIQETIERYLAPLCEGRFKPPTAEALKTYLARRK